MKKYQVIIDGVVALVGLALGGVVLALTDSEVATALNEVGIDETALIAGVVVAQQVFNRAAGVWRAIRGIFK